MPLRRRRLLAVAAIVVFLIAALALFLAGRSDVAYPFLLLIVPPMIFLGDDALTRRRARGAG